jgi:hypothetical protein
MSPWRRKPKQPWKSSASELETLHGVMSDPDRSEHAFFYFKDPTSVESMPANQQDDFIERQIQDEVD